MNLGQDLSYKKTKCLRCSDGQIMEKVRVRPLMYNYVSQNAFPHYQKTRIKNNMFAYSMIPLHVKMICYSKCSVRSLFGRLPDLCVT